MAEFKIDGSVLYVSGRLEATEDRNLQEWCKRLMQTTEPVITVDMSAVSQINSASIGVLSATWVDVITQDRSLDIVASPVVRKIFAMAGFDKVLHLRDP